jgi:hypothetical protein
MSTRKQSKPAAAPVLFKFHCPPDRARFVFLTTDPVRIEHARRILSGEETEAVHVSGVIVKSPAPYNSRWRFHLDPETISFFAVAMEVCDATITYVAEHLDEVGGSFLPSSRWCPWTSRLIREVPPAEC